jgi:CDP-2,3-bis-(O-geranylgeranyl)-sn-glycerol synthase
MEIFLIIASKAIYWFLPAFAANLAPVLVAKTNFLAQAISEKHLGSHKTYRGFFFGTLFAGIVFLLQQNFLKSNFWQSLEFPNIAFLPWWYGFVLGFGALFGDSVKSFFKRKFHRKPGQSWPPFDQLDFVFGGVLFSAPLFLPEFKYLLVLFLLTPFLHLGANIIGYLMGLKKVWW